MIVVLAVMLALAAAIGLFMETYKKVIRKDNAKVWEIRLIAAVLSVLAGVVMWAVVDEAVLSTYLTDTPFLIVPYAVIEYILQLPACMSFWKPILKKYIEKKVE